MPSPTGCQQPWHPGGRMPNTRVQGLDGTGRKDAEPGLNRTLGEQGQDREVSPCADGSKCVPGLRLPTAGGELLVVVEYQGGNLWAEAERDRKIGELWEELSGGKRRFVMVRDKHWSAIHRKLRRA